MNTISIMYRVNGVTKCLLCTPNQGSNYTKKDVSIISGMVAKLNDADAKGLYWVSYE